MSQSLDLSAVHNVGLEIRVNERTAAFRVGDEVRLSYAPFDESPVGVVTGIVVTPATFVYLVTWADNRRESGHHELELISID